MRGRTPPLSTEAVFDATLDARNDPHWMAEPDSACCLATNWVGAISVRNCQRVAGRA